jgi:hypothetical protein
MLSDIERHLLLHYIGGKRIIRAARSQQHLRLLASRNPWSISGAC